MTDQKWKSEIYEPYLETWKILKLIQYADQTTDSDAQWLRYIKEIDRLNKQYKGNEFVQDLITLLIEAGNAIAKMNKVET